MYIYIHIEPYTYVHMHIHMYTHTLYAYMYCYTESAYASYMPRQSPLEPVYARRVPYQGSSPESRHLPSNPAERQWPHLCQSHHDRIRRPLARCCSSWLLGGLRWSSPTAKFSSSPKYRLGHCTSGATSGWRLELLISYQSPKNGHTYTLGIYSQ